jgi:hypothetical protein
MDKFEQLEKEIKQIKIRNTAVEADKAWETSGVRKVIIALTTYVLVSAYMMILDVNKPFLNALIPTAGYFLSTLTITIVKNRWLNNRNK